MRRTLIVTALLAGAACAGSAPKPTGAGSTSVLRLLRDWRGVWSGTVKDSPMGAMPYTLYVEETAEGLRARMAPQKDLELDGMAHRYDLVSFDAGLPFIRYALTQRAATQEGELEYREDLSDDARAVFCPAAGCEKVQLAIRRVDDRRVIFATQVHESPHSTIQLAFVAREIPSATAPALERKAATPPPAPAPKASGGEPIDEDLRLPEHLDKDIPEGWAEPPPPKKRR